MGVRACGMHGRRVETLACIQIVSWLMEDIKGMKRLFLALLLVFLCTVSGAQTSDSLIVGQLRDEGVSFSHDNSVVLLTSGQEKFDDMFEAVRQARSSIHLEYFNFRNDSIASLLFGLLAEKAAQGVEVRALFDGFGNDSNNRPLKKEHFEDCAGLFRSRLTVALHRYW